MSNEKVKAPSAGAPSGAAHAAGANENKEQRKAHRFRVNWHTDIIFADQSMHQGFINDISVQGASVFLSDSLTTDTAMLHIHVPPLTLTSEPRVIAVMGKSVYVVFDGDKQLFRTAFMFLKFHQESDRAYLEERLSKYQVEIQESAHLNIVEL